MDFARRLVVDGLLRRVDKPVCRPLLFGTWSSFLLLLCLRVAVDHSSSIEDDVMLVLTSLSLLCQYITTTKVGFYCCFVLIH